MKAPHWTFRKMFVALGLDAETSAEIIRTAYRFTSDQAHLVRSGSNGLERTGRVETPRPAAGGYFKHRGRATVDSLDAAGIRKSL